MFDQDAAKRMLETRLPENDASAETVREYLLELLSQVLLCEESFSGKRPFGNSGWTYDIVGPLSEKGFCNEDCSPGDSEWKELVWALVDAL